MGRQRGGWAAQECQPRQARLRRGGHEAREFLKPVLNEDSLGGRCELFFDYEEAWGKFMSRALRFLAATRRA